MYVRFLLNGWLQYSTTHLRKLRKCHDVSGVSYSSRSFDIVWLSANIFFCVTFVKRSCCRISAQCETLTLLSERRWCEMLHELDHSTRKLSKQRQLDDRVNMFNGFDTTWIFLAVKAILIRELDMCIRVVFTTERWIKDSIAWSVAQYFIFYIILFFIFAFTAIFFFFFFFCRAVEHFSFSLYVCSYMSARWEGFLYSLYSLTGNQNFAAF